MLLPNTNWGKKKISDEHALPFPLKNGNADLIFRRNAEGKEEEEEEEEEENESPRIRTHTHSQKNQKHRKINILELELLAKKQPIDNM